MNEPTSPIATDPVEAALAAAGVPGDASAQPEGESPAQANVEAAKPEPEQRKARQYAEAADAKRRAAAAESKARAAAKEAKDLAAKAAQEKAELEGLFTGVKGNKAAVEKLLAKAGVSLDDLARTILEMPDEPVTADSKAEKALAEARALREQIEAEKAEIAKQQLLHNSKAAYDHFLKNCKTIISQDTTDKFELIKEHNAYPIVLDRALNLLKANEINEVSPEEEIQLYNFIATKLESELFEQAKASAGIYAKSNKLKALLNDLGIKSNNNGTQVPRDNDIASLSPEDQKVLNGLSQDSTQAKSRGNKFITNDTTVSSRPTSSVMSKAKSERDQLIDTLVAELGGGKSPF